MTEKSKSRRSSDLAGEMKNENKQTLPLATKTNRSPATSGTAIAVGNFDGLHLGHQCLMETLKKIARENNLLSMVMTFIPNPRAFFDKSMKLIFSDNQKRRVLGQLDVDRVEFIHFPGILELPGEDFVKNVLVIDFNMKYIVMGDNFRFGKDRGCTTECLEQLGRTHGFKLKVVEKLVLDGTAISSTLIREKLTRGEIQRCNNLLGAPYTIEGTVVEGEKIGRQMGFPTINIDTENKILPEGVFQTRLEINGEFHDSISYIGRRPTFDGTEKKVESHIFDFNREIYGHSVRLHFIKKIRGDKKFDSEQQLIQQIKKDIHTIKVDKDKVF